MFLKLRTAHQNFFLNFDKSAIKFPKSEEGSHRHPPLAPSLIGFQDVRIFKQLIYEIALFQQNISIKKTALEQSYV